MWSLSPNEVGGITQNAREEDGRKGGKDGVGRVNYGFGTRGYPSYSGS